MKGKPGVAGHLEVQLFALKTMTPVRPGSADSTDSNLSNLSSATGAGRV